MAVATLFRNWWVLLIQGILMIVLSVLIFNNPESVLTAIALWLGVIVAVGGLFGAISWFTNKNDERSNSTLIGSAVMLMIGTLMISQHDLTIKVITMVFGILVIVLGWTVLSGSWKHKNEWSTWWILAILGGITMLIGIKSFFDMYSGSETISNLIGFGVLIAGIGLIFFAFLKKKVVSTVKEKLHQ